MSNPDKHDIPAWHNLDSQNTFSALSASSSGLSSTEAEKRLQIYGYNKIRPMKTRGPLMRFLAQFHNVLIYVLIGAGVITGLLGHWVDCAVIFGVVVINALIGFIQEGKAEKALDAIRNILSQQASVIRDGKTTILPAEQLVPGDVVTLQSGDKVPADLRLFKVRELRIEEASLTGESMPVEKSVDAVHQASVIGDRHCMAFSSTLVTYGYAQGVVVATGDQTEIGRISDLLREITPLTTPLIRQMATFAKWLTIAIGIIAVLTFIFGVSIHDYGMGDMFMAAVGLAVAGIPEGLPAIMTITLAIGVQRMAQSHAIIRRLPAVETLGSVTVICSDKTGTLTRNEMTVQTIATVEGYCEVSGSGYDPHGGFSIDGVDSTPDNFPPLREICQAGLLCNDAQLIQNQGQWTIQGDPTEAALVTLAKKAGLESDYQHEQYPRIDAIPFESAHRFMATLHHDHAGHAFIYIKGAPEQLLSMCQSQRAGGRDEPLAKDYWHHCLQSMGGRGQRLLALAFKQADTSQQTLHFGDVDNGLTLLGLVGIIDPPRSEAITAVQDCRSAGIRVKMITGDHPATAHAIGTSMGIGEAKQAISGIELDTLTAEQLVEAVRSCDIFARVSPEQKLRLVTALQNDGEVVAMTGDGVNDAPALKRADVGIAMGKKGTEVAKESAEMVLTDDNFATIAKAVQEGRTVYENLKKSILFILPTNGGEAFTIIAAIIMGRMLPITPAQILWINMITAVTLALTLAFEPSERNVMKKPPRDPGEPLLSHFLVWRVLFVSLILVTGTFGLFVWERDNGASIELARTVAVNTLVMFEIFYLFSARYLNSFAFSTGWHRDNQYIFYAVVLLILFQLAFTYLGPMQILFATTAMSFADWIKVVMVGSSVLFLVELEKWIFSLWQTQSEPS